VLAVTHPEKYHVVMERIGDVFTPGDVLSEWLVTVAITANDLAGTRATTTSRRRGCLSRTW
jgi:hypothetical protein